ncbi:MAG TPA: hypothetical protein VID47_08270 [Actinomycetota bacterium]
MSRRAALWVVLALVAATVGVVALAAATHSYVPLFICWIFQAPIPWIAARSVKGRPAN